MSDKKQSITVNKQFLLLTVISVIIAVFIILFFYKLSKPKGSKTGETNSKTSKTQAINNSDGFLGEKGSEVKDEEGIVYIEEEKVKDGNLHSFNYHLQDKGKTVYFFIVKASDGTYRAAANACEVCFGSKKGFKQVGDRILCSNCQTLYTKDQIAVEKGGCNPRPIDKNVNVENGKLKLKVADIENSADLF